MNQPFILLLLLALTFFQAHSQNTIDQEFNDFKATHGKIYNEHQHRYRIQIYLKNKDKMAEHNANPIHSWQMDTTKFSDLSDQEFIYTHLTLITPSIKMNQQSTEQDLIVSQTNNLRGSQKDTPLVQATVSAVNWTAAGKVSPVKDQGNCGSCYAFSAVAAMEAASLIQKNKAVSLSEQQIVDCSSNEGNQGCTGGWPSYSMVYVINSNITTGTDYAYVGYAGKCQKSGGGFRISSYKSPYGCSGLISEVAKRPLTVQVDASSWKLYKTGVFNSCSSTVNINHAVLLSGVDSKGNWWIKNSWGKKWGQKGYILLAAGNSCGICNFPGYSPYI